MKEISKRIGIKWLNPDSTLTLLETNQYPDEKRLITSVFCFVVCDHKILFIKNKKPNRGIEIPGGHVELGEDPETAVCREVMEESFVDIYRSQLFALHKIENTRQDGKYPMIGYQAFYYTNNAKILDFIENDEIESRLFYSLEDAKLLEWSQYYPELYQLFLDYHLKNQND